MLVTVEASNDKTTAAAKSLLDLQVLEMPVRREQTTFVLGKGFTQLTRAAKECEAAHLEVCNGVGGTSIRFIGAPVSVEEGMSVEPR
jgi:hypothetical protein